MIFLESADWRRYRGHLIIARKTFLGRRKYDVWHRGRLIETLSDGVAAELHIDRSVERFPAAGRELGSGGHE